MKAFFRHIRYPVIVPWMLLFCSTVAAQTSEKLTLGGLPAVHRLVRGQAGLKAPVEILRDQWGVNHIYADNQHDLFFAQGYAAAKDRLFQFEVWRRRATGTVSEIFGPDELQRDIGARLFKFRGNLKDEFNHYHPQGEAIMKAYVEGVNAWIDEVLRNPEKLPVEFRILDIKPGKWTPDIVVSRHQGLLGNITEELNLGIAVARAGASKVKELVWFHPKDPQLDLDSTLRGDLLKEEILSLYNAYRRDIGFKPDHISISHKDSVELLERLNRFSPQGNAEPFRHGEGGSNNWVVNGSKTASGHAIMANDPHRVVAVPSLRYMVHLVAPGWNVIGGGEPVIPGVSIGHNEYGAWGLTVFKTDAEDLYVYDLNPDDLRQYRYKGKWLRMKEVRETIPVKGGVAVTVTLHYTTHGPVTYIDSLNRKGYAVKCGWLEPGGAPYLASLRMNQARDWEAFRDACSYSHIPGENMVWADRNGNIGWQAVGIVPVRRNFSGMVPVPGDGRYEWDGYLPIKQRPQVLNPKDGFFATANQNVTPDNYTNWNTVGFTWADPFRGDRINEVLGTNKTLSLDDMKALQTDYFSIPARTLVSLLSKIQIDKALAKEAQARLSGWEFVLSPNSVEAGIYAMWERQIMSHAREKFIPAELTGLVSVQLTRIIRWLENPEGRFGAQPIAGRDAFLRTTFEMAIEELKEKLGDSIDHWQYGQEKYKHITLVNHVPGLLNAQVKEKVDLGPLPRGGNSHTPNATGSDDNQTSGASFRIIVDVGDWDNTLMISTPGQSADPLSPFYGNLFELWARDEYFPAYYSREKIERVTKDRILMTPGKGKNK